MFRDMGEVPPQDFDVLRAASERWLEPRLASGEYRGWLAVDSLTVVAGGGLHLRELWPAPAYPRGGRWAHIGNVYTEPTHRGQGLARRIMEAIMQWCDDNKIDQITLAASDDGRALYESLGFRHDGRAMKAQPR